MQASLATFQTETDMTTQVDQTSVELLVSNLPLNANESQIEALFAVFSEDLEVRIAPRCTAGRSRRRTSERINPIQSTESAPWIQLELNHPR